MAATPEELLLGQGGFLVDPEEPFSPSVFIDLPPTPRLDGDDLATASDDLVLPFIARMLMEEDIDDKFFYQHPDHPALLQAQLPFAQILSDTTTATDSTISPSSSDVPAPADATWPCSDDPIGLSQSQQLRSSPWPDMPLHGFATDHPNAFLPAQDGASAGFQRNSVLLGNAADANAFSAGGCTGAAVGEEETKTESNTWPGATDGDNQCLDLFSGQIQGNLDMLNMAFLRGMEEANKFLPTSNGLHVDLKATSREQLPRHGFAAGQTKKEDGAVTFQGSPPNCRNRKHRHDRDDLVAEAGGRKGKLMVPEPDENGEMVDKMIIHGYELLLENMKSLRITMDSEAEKNTRKGTGKGKRKGKGKSAPERQSTNGLVDLETLLLHCAQAVATNDHRCAIELLRQIKQHSSPRGDATQRLAHCFTEGLEARLAGMGSQMYKSLMSKRISVMDLLNAYQLYLAACCFNIVAFIFCTRTICKVVAGRSKVHIVDYGVHYGLQWPTLLQFLACREGGPPEVRITGIDLPQPGFRPAAQIEETGRRLSNCARDFGVPFKFHSIASKWEMVGVDDLNIDPDEVLVVNGLIHFGNLMDEGINTDSLSPRNVVLSNIRKMRPDVFIFCVENGSYNSPFFVARFREALFHFSAMFDMLDATTPRDNGQRLLVERDLIGQCALNVIACEGSDRVERPETYKQWQVRNHRAGLRQLPLDPDVIKIVREKVESQYHKDFVIDMDHQWLLEGWKGRILYAMSTWVADGDVRNGI